MAMTAGMATVTRVSGSSKYLACALFELPPCLTLRWLTSLWDGGAALVCELPIHTSIQGTGAWCVARPDLALAYPWSRLFTNQY